MTMMMTTEARPPAGSPLTNDNHHQPPPASQQPQEEQHQAADENDQTNHNAMIPLSSQAFTEAVERFLDENKPDALAVQQMREWSFEWKPKEELKQKANDDDIQTTTTTATSQSQPPDKHYTLAGTLLWKSRYIILHLETHCEWRQHQQVNSNSNNNANDAALSGTLQFQCTARGEFRPFDDVVAAEAGAGDDAAGGDNASGDAGDNATIDSNQTQSKPNINNNAKERRIHQKMLQRLGQDSYLQKLMQPQPSCEVCDANILLGDQPNLGSDTDNHIQTLEERVNWKESTVEAIRRAVFSHAESTLDVLDLIVSFPCLPTTNPNATTTTTLPTTPLADRAKLRLLEAALLHACEQQEEDEIVQDLTISNKKKMRQ